MTSCIYDSRQDFATKMARIAAPSEVTFKWLPRTMAHDAQTHFEMFLHDAMGYKRSTVEDALY